MFPDFKLSALQTQPLNAVVAGLVLRYQPVAICCFGYRHSQNLRMNCFDRDANRERSHFFLLMVTEGRQRLEHEAQDYLNTHFPDVEITLLVHGEDTVAEQLKTGNWFFSRVLNLAERCYHKDGLLLQTPLPALDEAAVVAAARNCFIHRLAMAHGFYKGAQALRQDNYLPNALFLLHQCVEQTCSALIRVFLNYRSDIHNLSRLMKLCLCFTDLPLEVFPQESVADQRLFSLLQRSYSETRYREGFEIERDDYFKLEQRVKSLMDRMEVLCGEWLLGLVGVEVV